MRPSGRGTGDGGPRREANGEKCPICGKPRDGKYRPFCSRRCADVDLSRWFSGAYAIPGDAAAGERGSED